MLSHCITPWCYPWPPNPLSCNPWYPMKPATHKQPLASYLACDFDYSGNLPSLWVVHPLHSAHTESSMESRYWPPPSGWPSANWFSTFSREILIIFIVICTSYLGASNHINNQVIWLTLFTFFLVLLLGLVLILRNVHRSGASFEKYLSIN